MDKSMHVMITVTVMFLETIMNLGNSGSIPGELKSKTYYYVLQNNNNKLFIDFKIIYTKTLIIV